jgi:serine/threonine protein kinase
MPPFFAINVDFKNKKKEEELYFPNYLSDDLKDLLAKLLSKDPNERIGLKNKKEIKKHPWLKNIDWDKLLIKEIDSPINLLLIKEEIEESLKC